MGNSRRARAVILGVVLLLDCGGSHPVTPPDEPVPTPEPTPLPAAGVQGCGLPPGPGDGKRCPYNGAGFVAPVDMSIAQLMRDEPDIFEFGQCFSPLSCRVRDRDRYVAGMLRNLRAMGLCAIFDGEEFAIKNQNEFSDQYAAVSSTGYTRWGIGAYRATCRPAWF